MIDGEDATVSDVIAILRKLEVDGLGDYVVTCNGEYTLARKGEAGEVHNWSKTVDLGGYC